MTYAQRQEGVWRELRPTFPVVAADGRQASWDTFMAWDTATQEEFGGYAVPEPAAPEGKVELMRFLHPDGDRPEWNVSYVDAPLPGVPAPPPMPALSYRQFGRGLFADKIIDFDSALAFVGPGTLPKAMLDILNEIPDEMARQCAIIDATGAVEYQFDNPLVKYVQTKLEWTDEHLRERWLAWSEL